MGDKKPDYKKLPQFGLKVYIITLAVWLLRWDTGITLRYILLHSFPFMTYQWYVTSYIGVLILIPVLNTFLQNAEPRLLCKFALVSMIIFVTITLITQRDLFGLSQGGSVLWLSLLYLLGGTIKRLNLFQNVTAKAWMAGFVLSTLLAYGSKVLIEYWQMNRTGEYAECNILISYISPFIIIQSLCLFCAALKTNLRVPRLICKISKGILGCYVIHMHYRIIGPLINNKFAIYANQELFTMVFLIAATVISIFLISLALSVPLTYFSDFIWHRGCKIINHIRKLWK